MIWPGSESVIDCWKKERTHAESRSTQDRSERWLGNPIEMLKWRNRSWKCEMAQVKVLTRMHVGRVTTSAGAVTVLIFTEIINETIRVSLGLNDFSQSVYTVLR